MRDREEFIALMTAEGMPFETARKLMRYSATLSRLAEAACNRELTKAEEKKDQMTEAATRAILPEGYTAVFSGDPRGAVVKIKVPSGKTNDWGRIGICVPARS